MCRGLGLNLDDKMVLCWLVWEPRWPTWHHKVLGSFLGCRTRSLINSNFFFERRKTFDAFGFFVSSGGLRQLFLRTLSECCQNVNLRVRLLEASRCGDFEHP